MLNAIDIAIGAGLAAVVFLSLRIGKREGQDDVQNRVERLEEALRHQLKWSHAAEEEFDRIHARIEGVPKLGAYRSTGEPSAAGGEKSGT